MPEVSPKSVFRKFPWKIYRLYCLVLGIGAVLLGYFWYPQWAHDRQMQAGVKALDVGDTAAAYAHFLAAYEQNPDRGASLQKLLTLAEAHAEKKDLKQLAVRVETEQAQPAEYLLWVRLLQHWGQFEEASRGLQILLAERALDPLVQLAAGKGAQHRGDAKNARVHLQKAYRLQSKHPEIAYHWAMLLGESPLAFERILAKSQLRKLALEVEQPYAREAALALLVTPGLMLFEEDSQAIVEILLAQPEWRASIADGSPEELQILAMRTYAASPKTGWELFQELAKVQPLGAPALEILVNSELTHEQQQWVEMQFRRLSAESIEPNKLAMLRARLLLQSEPGAALAILQNVLIQSPANADVLHDLIKGLTSKELEEDVVTLDRWIRLILAHPATNISDELLVYNKLWTARPNNRQHIAEELRAGLAQTHPGTVVEWLLERQAYALILELFDAAFSRESKILSKGYYLALVNLQRFAAADRFLEETGGLFTGFERNLYQCRRYSLANEPAAAKSAWQQAYQLAPEAASPSDWLYLARLSSELGLAEQQFSAYYQAREMGATFAQEDWHAFFKAAFLGKQSEVDLRLIAQSAFNAFPEQAVFVNNFAYLSFLSESEFSALIEAMETVVAQYAEQPGYKVTLALGYFRMGKMREALELMEQFGLGLEKGSPGDQAVYAAVLAANGKNQFASSLVKQINLKVLLPGERALIDVLVDAQ